MSDRAFIMIRAPNGDVREVPVGSAPIVIGRDESADVRVDHRKVSRRHAAFKYTDGQLWVEDLGSINGVKMNGKRVDKRAVVSRRDVVLVGGYEIRLREAKDAGHAEREESEAFGRKIGMDDSETGDYIPVEGASEAQVSAQIPLKMPLLVGLDGPVKDRRFKLDRGDNILGRLEDCQVPILDGSVSRQHARIIVEAHRVYVQDLESSNGVYVNDVRVEEADINNGDRVRVGDISFRVEMPLQMSARIGPVVGHLDFSPEERTHRKGRSSPYYFVAGVTVLALAGGILGLAIYQGRNIPMPATILGFDNPLAKTTPPPKLDPAPRAASTPDAGTKPAVAVAPQGKTKTPEPLAKAKTKAPEPLAKAKTKAPEPRAPGPKPPGPGPEPPEKTRPVVARAPTPSAATSTSPFSRIGEDGWPKGMPVVDRSFDFDTFVATKLEAAETLEKEGRYKEVRAVLASLHDSDPINQESRAILSRLDVAEASKAALERANGLVEKGKLIEALVLYAGIPADAPQFARAKTQLDTLKPKALEREIARAKKEIRTKPGWKRAHKRLLAVLDLEPESEEAILAIQDLESRMRGKRVRFRPYVPPSSELRPPSDEKRKQIIARKYPNREIAELVEIYERGAIGKALKRAAALQRRASKSDKRKLSRMIAQMKRVKASYGRARNEISNDPNQAWFHLIEMKRAEKSILPDGLRSYHRVELEHSIAAAFSDLATALFEQQKYETAFQRWEAGYKLHPGNVRIRSGLKRLEEVAEKEAQNTELAGQGGAEVCERWRRITKMTVSGSDVHRRAKQRARAICKKG